MTSEKTTTSIILNATVNVAGRISRSEEYDFVTFVGNDGSGPFISIERPENDDDSEDYRCISLTDEAMCGEDLTKYRWNFWNHNTNTYEDSTLGADATVEQVMEFLNKSLEQEKKDSK